MNTFLFSFPPNWVAVQSRMPCFDDVIIILDGGWQRLWHRELHWCWEREKYLSGNSYLSPVDGKWSVTEVANGIAGDESNSPKNKNKNMPAGCVVGKQLGMVATKIRFRK